MDRNSVNCALRFPGCPSLSARRAWIEICLSCSNSVSCQSLSARRAWIEIDVKAATGLFTSVALRKESVDRNRA